MLPSRVLLPNERVVTPFAAISSHRQAFSSQIQCSLGASQPRSGGNPSPSQPSSSVRHRVAATVADAPPTTRRETEHSTRLELEERKVALNSVFWSPQSRPDSAQDDADAYKTPALDDSNAHEQTRSRKSSSLEASTSGLNSPDQGHAIPSSAAR